MFSFSSKLNFAASSSRVISSLNASLVQSLLLLICAIFSNYNKKNVKSQCLFAGGAEWPSLPPVGQTGHHQWAARVSSTCIKVHQYVTSGSVTTLWPCVVWIRFQKDPTWSETGDRYLLKLFRDHLFHQVTEAGTPWIDLSHIVSCLNKVSFLLFLLLCWLYLNMQNCNKLPFIMKSVQHAKWPIFRTSVHASYALAKITCLHLPTDCRRERVKVGL